MYGQYQALCQGSSDAQKIFDHVFDEDILDLSSFVADVSGDFRSRRIPVGYMTNCLQSLYSLITFGFLQSPLDNVQVPTNINEYERTNTNTNEYQEILTTGEY